MPQPQPKPFELDSSGEHDHAHAEHAAPPRAPRRRKAEEAKPVDLAASGLQLVETKTDAAKTEPVAAEPAAPAKSRKTAAWKQKAAPAEVPAEPLVMVETQK